MSRAQTVARARALMAGGMEKNAAVRQAVDEAVKAAARRMRRPSYRDAIAWLVGNDDSDWAQHSDEDYRAGVGGSNLAVTACLVADLFGVDHDRIRADVRAGLRKAGRLH